VLPVTVVVTVVLPVDVLLDVSVAETELVALDVAVDDALPELLLVPVLVRLLASRSGRAPPSGARTAPRTGSPSAASRHRPST
jgi:hypothetical protein